MKKIMIAFGAVAIAMSIQAATVNWGSGAIYTPGAEGVFTSTRVAASSVSYYLWTMDASSYDALTDITKLDKASAVATGKNSAIGGTVSYNDTTTYNAGDTVNWAIIFIYTDSDGKEWYIANKGSGSVDDLGSRLAFSNLAVTNYGGSAISGWTGAIPEPTSGLLLLLGVAGLALKRKRA